MSIVFDGWIASSGVINPALLNKESHTADEIQVVPDPAGGLGSAAKLTIRAVDSQVASGYRTEISPVSGERQAQGARWWYAWEMFVPEDFNFATMTPGHRATVWQLHDPASNPPLLFAHLACDGRLYIGRNEVTGATSALIDECLYEMVIRRGVWHKFVLHANFSYNEDVGFFDLWIDGQKVLRVRTKTMYSEAGNVYWKQGIYWARSNLPASGEWSLYSKGLLVGDDAYTRYEDFAAAAGIDASEVFGSVLTESGPRSWLHVPSGGYAEAPSIAAYSMGSADLRISAWVRPTKPNSGSNHQTIVSDRSDTWGLRLENFGNRTVSKARLDAKDSSAAAHDTRCGNRVLWRRRGKWTRIEAAISRATGAAEFWINGQRYECTTVSSDYANAQAAFSGFAASTNPVRIGQGSVGGRQFIGDIADVCVWRGTELVGRWAKTGGTTTTLYDASGYANHATLGGGARWVI